MGGIVGGIAGGVAGGNLGPEETEDGTFGYTENPGIWLGTEVADLMWGVGCFEVQIAYSEVRPASPIFLLEPGGILA